MNDEIQWFIRHGMHRSELLLARHHPARCGQHLRRRDPNPVHIAHAEAETMLFIMINSCEIN